MAKPSVRRATNKSNRNHVLWAVRRGRQHGSFRAWDGADGAEEQVKGFSGNCHLGFTQRQVDLGIHLKYLRGEYGGTGSGESRQIRKIRAGRVPKKQTDTDDSDTVDEESNAAMPGSSC